MYKGIVLAGFFIFSSFATVGATEKAIDSPNGTLHVVVSDNGGKPTYKVSLGDVVFLQESPLGLKMNFDDLTQGVSIKDCTVGKVSEEYTMKTIKQSRVEYEATEAVVKFEKDNHDVMDIIFRVSNRDVAYCYKIYPKGGTIAGVVEREASGFALPEGTTTFLCPQSKPMVGFART